MKSLIFIVLSLVLFTNCSCVRSGISDEMIIGLLSFDQESIGYYSSIEEKDLNKPIAEKISDSVYIISFFTEESGSPAFEGGYKLIGKTLTLYYQDVDMQPLKSINIYKLKYQIIIEDEDFDFDEIEIVRLYPIKRGL